MCLMSTNKIRAKDIEVDSRDPVVRISFDETKGKIDIRYMYQMKDGELGYTKRGIQFPVELWEEIVQTVDEVVNEPKP